MKITAEYHNLSTETIYESLNRHHNLYTITIFITKIIPHPQQNLKLYTMPNAFHIPSITFLRLPPNNDMRGPPWTLPSGISKSKLLLPLLLPTPMSNLFPSAFSAFKKFENDDEDFIDKGTNTCGGISCCLFAGFASELMQSDTTLIPEVEWLLLLPAVVEAADTSP